MKTANENLMTQYLLGELSDEGKRRLEEQFFSDDEAFAQLQALEDELRYDYARGGLSGAQRRQFEQRFLSLPGAPQRVALAQAVLETVAQANLPQAPERKIVAADSPSFFRSLSAWLQSSGLQIGLAAASLLLLLGGSWLAYQTVTLRSQVQQLEVARAGQEQQRRQLEQQAADQRTRGEQLNAQLETERRQRTELEQELAKQKAEAARANESAAPSTLLSFLLTPGLSRDIDSTKRLTIPTTASQVRLQLTLKRPGNYQGYQAVLQTLDGANLWSRNLPGGRGVTVTIPAKLLPPGDYVVVLKGQTAGGQLEEIDEYHFNAARP